MLLGCFCFVFCFVVVFVFFVFLRGGGGGGNSGKTGEERRKEGRRWGIGLWCGVREGVRRGGGLVSEQSADAFTIKMSVHCAWTVSRLFPFAELSLGRRSFFSSQCSTYWGICSTASPLILFCNQ